MKVNDEFPYTDPLPWSSTTAAIALRIPGVAEGVHPCVDCPAPCCQVVVLRRSQIVLEEDLDLVERYLSYENAIAWIEEGGSYAIIFVTPCRKLDRETLGCTVHASSEQPRVCDKYDAHHCWYRKCNGPIPPGRLKLDRARWDAYRDETAVLSNGLIMRLPPADMHCQQSPVVFDTPVSLAFEVPNKRIDDDYLFFLSNFKQIRLARMSSRWLIVYDTRRISTSTPVDEERTKPPPGVLSTEDVVFVTGAEIRSLRKVVPEGLVGLGPAQIRDHLQSM